MLSVYTAVLGCISSNDTVLISACSGCGMHSAGFRLVPSVVVLVSGSHSADVTKLTIMLVQYALQEFVLIYTPTECAIKFCV